MNEPLIIAIMLGHGAPLDVFLARLVLGALVAAPFLWFGAVWACRPRRKPTWRYDHVSRRDIMGRR